MEKIAVILFNLGAPDKLESVQPFLFNLFNDPAIFRMPSFIRKPLAKFVSKKRAPYASGIYAKIGGSSPLLENTEKQAKSLEKVLKKNLKNENIKTFTCMRYWHPMTEEVVENVKKYNPDKVVLLPLYPQFSTTTSDSSINEWKDICEKKGFTAPTKTICCYPVEEGFIDAVTGLIKKELKKAKHKPRLLFSAHGLPKKIVDQGDPYQWQVEKTVHKVLEKLDRESFEQSTICYQSKVGPLEWLGPSLDDEIQRAGKDKVAVAIIPVAFVSEHSETLYELDMEVKEEAIALGIPEYIRIQTVQESKTFIKGLAELVEKIIEFKDNMMSDLPEKVCPPLFSGCPHKNKE